jgi:NAD(P)-dependent dehydrogenase (short-subunit alcohol dehydrogenase family)
MKHVIAKLRTWIEGETSRLPWGTSGIGYAVAERAALEGASQEKVDRAISRLRHDAKGYAVDLSNEAQVRQLFNQIGEFDHLVFTAGEPLQPEALSTMDIDAASQFFNLRYWGELMAAKYGSGHIKAGGSITLVSGTTGMRPKKGSTIGASLCGAIEALTRALAVELGPLRVNAVCLGFMHTEMWNGIPDAERKNPEIYNFVTCDGTLDCQAPHEYLYLYIFNSQEDRVKSIDDLNKQMQKYAESTSCCMAEKKCDGNILACRIS